MISTRHKPENRKNDGGVDQDGLLGKDSVLLFTCKGVSSSNERTKELKPSAVGQQMHAVTQDTPEYLVTLIDGQPQQQQNKSQGFGCISGNSRGGKKASSYNTHTLIKHLYVVSMSLTINRSSFLRSNRFTEIKTDVLKDRGTGCVCAHIIIIIIIIIILNMTKQFIILDSLYTREMNG